MHKHTYKQESKKKKKQLKVIPIYTLKKKCREVAVEGVKDWYYTRFFSSFTTSLTQPLHTYRQTITTIGTASAMEVLVSSCS